MSAADPTLYVRYLNAFTAALTGVGIPADPALSPEAALAVAIGAYDGADAMWYCMHLRDADDDFSAGAVIAEPHNLERQVQVILGITPEQLAAKARNAAETT